MYNIQGKFILNLDKFTNTESSIENNKTNTPIPNIISTSNPTSNPTSDPTSNPTINLTNYPTTRYQTNSPNTSNITNNTIRKNKKNTTDNSLRNNNKNTIENSSTNTTKKEKVKLDFKYVYLVWIFSSVYYFSCIFFYESECRKYGLISGKPISELSYFEKIMIPIGLIYATSILSSLVLRLTNLDNIDKSDTGKTMNALAKISQIGNINYNDKQDKGCNLRFKYRTKNKKHSYYGYGYCYLDPDCAIDENSKSYCDKEWTGKASNEYIKRTNRMNNISVYIGDDNDDEPDEGCNMKYKYRTQNIKHSYNGYDFCYSHPECAIDENRRVLCSYNNEWVGKASNEYIKSTNRINKISITRGVN